MSGEQLSTRVSDTSPVLAEADVRSDVAPTTPKPPLKWAGGKRWQVPHLRPLWESHDRRRLVEPFCGGLAVALGLQPRQALLNDVNPHVTDFYYAQRDRFNELLARGAGKSAEAAMLFYYLNRTGYNGLCRFNRQGLFNVPFGRYTQINYTTDFSAYRRVFASWTFTSTDCEAVPLTSADFVYADPPYDVEFTHYSKGGFTWEDQVRTAEWLARHPGPVVLSNQATSRIIELYTSLGFTLQFLKAPRMISCTGDRTPAREVLAVRNVAV